VRDDALVVEGEERDDEEGGAHHDGEGELLDAAHRRRST
jgi:hypothetical protein